MSDATKAEAEERNSSNTEAEDPNFRPLWPEAADIVHAMGSDLESGSGPKTKEHENILVDVFDTTDRFHVPFTLDELSADDQQTVVKFQRGDFVVGHFEEASDPALLTPNDLGAAYASGFQDGYWKAKMEPE